MADPTGGQTPCSACGRSLSKKAFSKNQLTKGDAKRCKECVESNTQQPSQEARVPRVIEQGFSVPDEYRRGGGRGSGAPAAGASAAAAADALLEFLDNLRPTDGPAKAKRLRSLTADLSRISDDTDERDVPLYMARTRTEGSKTHRVQKYENVPSTSGPAVP